MAIELLAVLAIILILFCMYWGGGLGAFGGSGPHDFANCAKNMQFIHTAMSTYAMDHNDLFPFVAKAETSDIPLAGLVPKYTSQTSSFICPASGDRALPEGKPFAKKRISYGYVMGLSRTNAPNQFILSDEQLDTQPKGAGAPIFSADGKGRARNHGAGGGNVLFIDGSVETVPARTSYTLAFDNGIFLNPKPRP